MSWSVTASGSPKEVEEQLKSNNYATGESVSDKEYQESLPKLVDLVNCNKDVKVSLSAWGHSTTDGKNGVDINMQFTY